MFDFYLSNRVAHNCHTKTECSQQIQITRNKFKSLTTFSNYSQQIQIIHSKLQITHIKFKSSQQIPTSFLGSLSSAFIVVEKRIQK